MVMAEAPNSGSNSNNPYSYSSRIPPPPPPPPRQKQQRKTVIRDDDKNDLDDDDDDDKHDTTQQQEKNENNNNDIENTTKATLIEQAEAMNDETMEKNTTTKSSKTDERTNIRDKINEEQSEASITTATATATVTKKKKSSIEEEDSTENADDTTPQESKSKNSATENLSPTTTAAKTDKDQETPSENNNTILVQITETEIWDGKQWRAPGLLSKESLRWTDENGEPCPPPAQQKLPQNNLVWSGDWKILTHTHERDAFGWEYSHVKPYPWRQRTWLRTAAPKPVKTRAPKRSIRDRRKNAVSGKEEEEEEASDEEKITATTKPKKQKKQKRRKEAALTTRSTRPARSLPSFWSTNRRLPRVVRSLADDFNFKGFGISCWKSLVFAKSLGVTFRIPISTNFNQWDGNPNLPSLAVSLGLFYPTLAGIYVSSSMPLVSLKFFCTYLYRVAFYLLLSSLWTLCRGLFLAASAVAFPVTRKLYNPPLPVVAPWDSTQGPTFQQDVFERVGFSYSWKISSQRGFHREGKVFHYYGHTISSLWNKLPTARLPFAKQVPAWVTQRSAATGFEFIGPLHSEPYVSCSGALSLSGFYLRPKKQPQDLLQQQQQFANAALAGNDEETDEGDITKQTRKERNDREESESSLMASLDGASDVGKVSSG